MKEAGNIPDLNPIRSMENFEDFSANHPQEWDNLLLAIRRIKEILTKLNIDVELLPDQTGKSGKVLKTDGKNASWSTDLTDTAAGLATHIADTTTHGTTGDVVGTSDTQEITNKKFGGPINYSEFLSDGTLKHRGDATAWKDMIADLFGKRLNSVAGTVDYDYDENTIVFSPNGGITDVNDRVGGNNEINHEFVVGTNITFKPHIHWWQQVTSGAVASIVFTARYRLQRNNAAKATSWTTITADAGTADDVFDFTSESDGLYNQITRFDDITITCGISDTIQFQLTRTDSETGDVSVYFMDLHGEVDSTGSDAEITKTT